VQGRLRQESLSVTVRTECAHCSRPMRVTVDSELKYQVHDEGAKPLVFLPQVDWGTFTASNIIDAY